MQTIRDFDTWFLAIKPPKPKVIDKIIESFKNQKNVSQERDFCSNKRV